MTSQDPQPPGLTTWAVIPARGGSKAIPRKNLADLGGRPLLSWTISAARGAALDRVLVSTEDPEVERLSSDLGVEVLRRTPELAEDSVHASDVVVDALQRGSDTDNPLPDVVYMLLPTAPFRTDEQIAEGVRLLRSNPTATAVIGVCRLHWRRENFRVLERGWLRPLLPLADPNVQRQDSPTLYAVNGALFAARTAPFLEHGTFHLPDALPLVMDDRSSTDIDTPQELEWARAHVAEHVDPTRSQL